jgi:kinesin family member 2/24
MLVLTTCTQPIFDIESRQPSKTLIIAHVSPHIQDTVHSVNTLSYASPFKTAPAKPRGPAPYDAADPRTWTHEQTLIWLTDQFTKRSRARITHAHDARARKAALDGRKLKPLDPAAPVRPPVDVGALCPAGMTAKHYGAMYTIEFVQRCLECANPGSEFSADVVKNIAGEVVGQLYYLILSAKTRKRKAIMTSRKPVSLDTYGASCPLLCAAVHLLTSCTGESPLNTIPGTNIEWPKEGAPDHEMFRRYTRSQFAMCWQRRNARWYDEINAAVVEAREKNKDKDVPRGGEIETQAEWEAITRMMEEEFGTGETAAEASSA